MPREAAQRLLTDAYRGLDEGKILRLTHKLLRRRGIDPPLDVQYVADPAVEEVPEGLGIRLGTDILVYDEFPEMDDCLEAFEDALNDLLLARLDKMIRGWNKRHPP